MSKLCTRGKVKQRRNDKNEDFVRGQRFAKYLRGYQAKYKN